MLNPGAFQYYIDFENEEVWIEDRLEVKWFGDGPYRVDVHDVHMAWVFSSK